MATNSSIEWTDATWLKVFVRYHQNVNKSLVALLQSGINPFVWIGVILAAVASRAAGDDVSRKRAPMFTDGNYVVPSRRRICTVRATTVELLQENLLSINWNRSYTAFSRYCVLLPFRTICRIVRVSSPLIFVVTISALAPSNNVFRVPRFAHGAPQQTERAIHLPLGLRRTLFAAQGSALDTRRSEPVVSGTINPKNTAAFPLATFSAPLEPCGRSDVVFVKGNSDSFRSDFCGSDCASHVHTI